VRVRGVVRVNVGVVDPVDGVDRTEAPATFGQQYTQQTRPPAALCRVGTQVTAAHSVGGGGVKYAADWQNSATVDGGV
jgi:hypothetical protein